MWYQSAATKIRPASLSVKIESDITCICTGRWDPFSRMEERERDREGGGLWERIRELEVLLASVKKSEKKEKGEWKQWERKRKRVVTARKNPYFEEGWKTERQKELRRERERGKVRSKQQSTQETGKDREYDVTRAAHLSTQWHTVTARLSLPVQIQHHHSCSSVGKRNTFWEGDSCRENVPVVSHISKWTVEGTSLNSIFINHKAMAYDSAATHLKVFHWIDTEYRKPQMGAQCQQTTNVWKCVC